MLERPKILTRVTIPTGGWQLRLKVSVSTSLDTTVDCTLAAGDYFLAWDHQTTDFLYELCRTVNVAINASAFTLPSDEGMSAYITAAPNHKVKLGFEGAVFQGAFGEDVSIDWTVLNGTDIAKVLGFDSSAADTSTGVENPTFTSDFHHAYGWYADDDGYLVRHLIEDVEIATSPQAMGPGGLVKTQFIAGRFSNVLDLAWLKRTEMYSSGVSYGTAPVEPYDRNRGLECWWREARLGTEFRVYRNSRLDKGDETGTATSGTATTSTDTGKSHSTEPPRWDGRLLHFASGVWPTDTGAPIRFYIASHTPTVITVANASVSPGHSAGKSMTAQAYTLFDQPYRTYWVDMNAMREFRPSEVDNIDRFDINLPLLRYET